MGTGSGYQAAVLAELCQHVYSIEIIEALGDATTQLIEKQGYDNIHTRIADGYEGWPQHAPFDGIMVTAAISHIPPPLVAQLKKGGRMVIPVGDRFHQKLLRLTKVKGRIIEEKVINVRFVPMVNEKGKKY